MTVKSINLAGQTLDLLPQRAVFWRQRNALLLADLHLGKDATFRRAGLAIPEGDNQSTLQRVDALIRAWQPQSLILLGDVLHTSLAADPGLHRQLIDWRASQPDLAVTAIIGNHDRDIRRLEPVIDCQVEGVEQSGLILRHHPPEAPADAPWIGGHWHPVVRLTAGGDSLRLPAFVHDAGDGVVLPAFGGLTGGALVKRRPGRRRYVTSDAAVFGIDTRETAD